MILYQNEKEKQDIIRVFDSGHYNGITAKEAELIASVRYLLVSGTVKPESFIPEKVPVNLTGVTDIKKSGK